MKLGIMLGDGILVVVLVQEVWYMCAPPLGGGGTSGLGTSQSREQKVKAKMKQTPTARRPVYGRLIRDLVFFTPQTEGHG